jgi:hypothetical protein
MRSTVLSKDFIILNRGVISIVGPVNKTSIGSVSVGAEISGGDVVSDSEGTVAVILSNAFLILRRGESDVDGVEVSVGSRSQMVFSGPGGLDTEGRRYLPGGLFHPGSSFGLAFDGVVLGLGNLGFGHLAISLGFDVLRFLLVEFAIGLVGSEDGNISPGRRMPVRIVISLLGAFITLSVSVVVLSGEDGGSSSSVKVSFFFTISNKETHVSFSVLAILIVLVRLVHSVKEISVTVNGNWSVEIVGDGIGGGSISNSDHGISVFGGADILDNHVAIHLGVNTTSVLNSPFEGHLGSFVVRHSRSNAISSLGVVLRVEQSVSIVSVGVCLVQSVV